MLTNFLRTNDDDGLLSGTHNADDPTGMYAKKTAKLTGAAGITKDYAGKVYTNNAANSSSDGGPDLRVSSGITYWLMQDYHLEDFYQLSASSVVGPYVGYEGFYGTTSKSSALSGSFYIKDGSQTVSYTTDGWDTLTKQVTIPSNVNRLRINWGLSGAQGSIYFHNFRLTPQGIDTSKDAVDGDNVLKVTNNMSWTSDPIAVVTGGEYSYKLSVMTDSQSTGLITIMFKDSEGNIISEETLTQSRTTVWNAIDGAVTVPSGTAYAEIKLENGTGTGDVWYDNIIFTQTADSVPTYITIEADNTLVMSPLSGEYRYMFTAKVMDQYNSSYDSDVEWNVDYDGLTILENGVLLVSSDAAAGTAVIKASVSTENGTISDEYTVTIVKQAENAASVALVNGSFTETDEDDSIMPYGWTDSDRELSLANNTFDSSITGWKLNYTTYTTSDTSATIEWDENTDHTGNSGGSAKIYNADRAQGSMQISENISVVGGGLYTVTVWVKTENVSTDSNIYATLIEYDKNSSTLAEDKQLLYFNPTDDDGAGNDTTGWTKLTGQILLDSNTVKLRIDLRYRGGANNSGGTVWFDDLSVTKQASLDSNVEYVGTPTLMITGYGLEADDVSRDYGEKWDSTAIENITAGQDYYYSVQAKTLNATDGAYVMITYYNSSGKSVGVYRSELVDAEEWTQIQGSATAPDGASYAVMSLCVDGTGKAWFAYASFETKEETEVMSIFITGDETVMRPSTNYYYTQFTDQYGLTSDILNIGVTAGALPDGVSYDSGSGKLTVAEDAAAGESVTLMSEYGSLSASKTVTTIAETESISISGSSTVTISKSNDKTVTYKLYNQLKQQIDSSAAEWTVSSSDVSISDGVLTVPAGVSAKTITITAKYNGLKATVSVTLSTASAGSGGSGGSGGGGSTVTTSATAAPSAMGNFTESSSGDSTSSESSSGEALIPQPDMTYFTQGMDNIGGFTDIGNVAWAQKAIVSLSSVGIVSGKEETKFYPDDSISRAEFTKILIGTLLYAERIDSDGAECNFSDVAEDAWYYEYVATAVEYGIVKGVSDTDFSPDALITRQDMCVMIERACDTADIALTEGALLTFNDGADISDYAKDAVDNMSRAGIVSGFEDGTFRPFENATRAQAAVMIYRMAGGTD